MNNNKTTTDFLHFKPKKFAELYQDNIIIQFTKVYQYGDGEFQARVRIYKVNEYGKFKNIKDYRQIISDINQFNKFSKKINEQLHKRNYVEFRPTHEKDVVSYLLDNSLLNE